jgi:hypothetical protein
MLKTTNYLIKKTETLIPTAYACITKLTISGLQGTATLAIQLSREKCERVRKGELEAIHEVPINFVVDYAKHISTTIYETAKGFIEREIWDNELNQNVIKKFPNYFNGWEDDIV